MPFFPEAMTFDASERLATFLRNNSSLGPPEVELACSHFRTETLARETRLVAQGRRYRKLVFVADGILRVFVTAPDGQEAVRNFVEPGDFFAAMECWDSDLPAPMNVSTVTGCTLLTLSREDARSLADSIPQWELLIQAGAAKAMGDMIRKQAFLRVGDSAQQYRRFVELYPDLARRAPLKHVASFLGITQSSLSRIRKKGW